MSPVKDCGDGKLICELKHSKDSMLPVSPSLTWCVREERIEIQIWLSSRRHDADNTSRKRDRLLGSAFVDVSSLLVSQQRKHRQIRCESSPVRPVIREKGGRGTPSKFQYRSVPPNRVMFLGL